MNLKKALAESKKAAAESKMMKVQYRHGESGWAEDLGDGTCRIANVPFDGGAGFSIDDVVRWENYDEGPHDGKVYRCRRVVRDKKGRPAVVTRRYSFAATIRYPDTNVNGLIGKDGTLSDDTCCRVNYATIWGACVARGWRLEGGVPGLASLACDVKRDVVEKLLVEIGLGQVAAWGKTDKVGTS